GACNGYPQNTIALGSVSANFVPLGDNHRAEIVTKSGRSSKFRRAAVNRVYKDRRWLVPRSASGTSVLFERWNSGVG
ncbi:hypothetical protein, partial [Rubripirellula obstinata]